VDKDTGLPACAAEQLVPGAAGDAAAVGAETDQFRLACPCAAFRATGRVSRRCSKPVTVTGHPERDPAVHTGTGTEPGPDGHPIAPANAALLRAAAARKAGARQ
jgi:hypothetical protein